MSEERIAVIEILISELVNQYAIDTDHYIGGLLSGHEFDRISEQFALATKTLIDELAGIENEKRKNQ